MKNFRIQRRTGYMAILGLVVLLCGHTYVAKLTADAGAAADLAQATSQGATDGTNQGTTDGGNVTQSAGVITAQPAAAAMNANNVPMNIQTLGAGVNTYASNATPSTAYIAAYNSAYYIAFATARYNAMYNTALAAYNAATSAWQSVGQLQGKAQAALAKASNADAQTGVDPATDANITTLTAAVNTYYPQVASATTTKNNANAAYTAALNDYNTATSAIQQGGIDGKNDGVSDANAGRAAATVTPAARATAAQQNYTFNDTQDNLYLVYNGAYMQAYTPAYTNTPHKAAQPTATTTKPTMVAPTTAAPTTIKPAITAPTTAIPSTTKAVTPTATASTSASTSAIINNIWALDTSGIMYCRTGVTSKLVIGTGWQKVSAPLSNNNLAVCVAAAPNGVVFCLDGNGVVYHTTQAAVSANPSSATLWTAIPNTGAIQLTQIAVTTEGALLALAGNGPIIYCCNNVSNNYAISNWVPISSASRNITYLAGAVNNTVCYVASPGSANYNNGCVYYKTYGSNQTFTAAAMSTYQAQPWQTINVSASQVASGISGTTWYVNTSGTAFYSTNGTSWTQTQGSNVSSIAAGSSGLVCYINNNNQVFYGLQSAFSTNPNASWTLFPNTTKAIKQISIGTQSPGQ